MEFYSFTCIIDSARAEEASKAIVGKLRTRFYILLALVIGYMFLRSFKGNLDAGFVTLFLIFPGNIYLWLDKASIQGGELADFRKYLGK